MQAVQSVLVYRVLLRQTVVVVIPIGVIDNTHILAARARAKANARARGREGSLLLQSSHTKKNLIQMLASSNRDDFQAWEWIRAGIYGTSTSFIEYF